ncbi:MAG: hypothetical protein C0524_09140 [Rhodobacter sp.]|nr:hypothetical protein [Rhodobacter sp.]
MQAGINADAGVLAATIARRLPSGEFGSGGADVFDDRSIIGHIRFSYYGYTDTFLKPDADDAALARLYDETRMARRFFLFERLTLPSLRAQTDQNFHILIMSSDAMPEVYKERLRQVTAKCRRSGSCFRRCGAACSPTSSTWSRHLAPISPERRCIFVWTTMMRWPGPISSACASCRKACRRQRISPFPRASFCSRPSRAAPTAHR